MKNTETIITVHCDRCHFQGSREYPNRSVRRYFGKSISVASDSLSRGMTQLKERGWWMGRKWHLCPGCSAAEQKRSRKGKAKIVNLEAA